MVSAYADLVRPLTYIDFNYKLVQKSINRVLYNITFEFCSSYKDLPPYMNFILNAFKKYSNNLIHACPYKPENGIGIVNYPMEANIAFMMVMNYPLGDYLNSYYGKDKQGNLIFYIKTYSTLSQTRVRKPAKGT